MNHVAPMWLALGFAGQVAFSGRFIVQWIASERAGRSVVPVMFWSFSIAGSLLLLVYAVHQRDPVFVLGQSTGLLIYLRNVYLIRKEARASDGAR